MAKFQSCENCGSNLDHGEKCDCLENEVNDESYQAPLDSIKGDIK